MSPGRALALSLLLHVAVLLVPLAPRTGSSLQPPVLPVLQVGWQVSMVEPEPSPPARPEPVVPITVPAPQANAPALPVLPPPRYYRSDEVDRRAEPVETPPIVIPELAYVKAIRGKLRVRIFVGATGAVEDAEILSASPPGVYEAAVLEAVTAMRFEPARLAGRPVGNVKELSIELDPYETISQP